MGYPTCTSNTGLHTSLNLSAETQVVIGAGFVYSVSVLTTGPCAVADVAGSLAAGNTMARTPTAVGIYQVNMPFSKGLVVKPEGGTASVCYES